MALPGRPWKRAEEDGAFLGGIADEADAVVGGFVVVADASSLTVIFAGEGFGEIPHGVGIEGGSWRSELPGACEERWRGVVA